TSISPPRILARFARARTSMQIEKNKVVSFHYALKVNGEAVDSSRERGEPLSILAGHGGIIEGLDKALTGHVTGDRFDVSIAPAEGYGERQESSMQRVPKKYFRDADHLRAGGMTVLTEKNGQQRQVTIVKVGSSVVDVDTNHPLAGQTLDFDIEITDVRDATAEELAHGHVHGPNGHQH
ncbi:MAG: peptidylprolyl isomerase, partial [Dokdonella sp.]